MKINNEAIIHNLKIEVTPEENELLKNIMAVTYMYPTQYDDGWSCTVLNASLDDDRINLDEDEINETGQALADLMNLIIKEIKQIKAK